MLGASKRVRKQDNMENRYEDLTLFVYIYKNNTTLTILSVGTEKTIVLTNGQNYTASFLAFVEANKKLLPPTPISLLYYSGYY